MRNLLLVLFLGLSQVGGIGGFGGVGGAGGGPTSTCTLPTNLTYRWLPAPGCSTSSPCMTDTVSGNNASQTISGDLPTYSSTGGGANGNNSYLTFNGTSDYLIPTTAIPTTANVYTFYAVFELTTASVTNPLFGSSSAYSTPGVVWYVTSSNLLRDSNNGPVFYTGTNTYSSTSTWYAVAAEFSVSGNTQSLYKCTSGTCTADGSGGTNTFGAITATTNWLGASQLLGPNFLHAKVSEFGYYNGNSLTGLGAYVNCQYGI